MQPSHIKSFTIDLKIGDKTAFFLAADNEGMLQRSDGTQVKITRDHGEVFQTIISELDQEILKRLNTNGKMESPDIKGERCTLLLIFVGENESHESKTCGLEIVYGSKSKAPPKPIMDLVKNSEELTKNI